MFFEVSAIVGSDLIELTAGACCFTMEAGGLGGPTNCSPSVAAEFLVVARLTPFGAGPR